MSAFVASLYIVIRLSFFFFFNDTATTEIYTLSLHDALPISVPLLTREGEVTIAKRIERGQLVVMKSITDRKSTRLNSSHRCISYAVFCLKKKKKRKLHASRSNLTHDVLTNL